MMMRLAILCLSMMLTTSVSFAWQLSKTEETALERIDQRKYREARKLAEQAMNEPPGIVARYVLSLVQSDNEGNLPRALFLLNEAKSRLEKVEDLSNPSALGREWHRKLLLHELGILGHLDRRAEQLRLIDVYEQYHTPKITERRIWPMVKLGQYDAARKLGISLLKHEDIDVRQRALNGLMAVEEEAGNRQASFDWGHRALNELGSRSCVITTNTALGARRIFDFSKAITLDLKALEAEQKDCPTSPHAQLAPVYLLSGDFQKSVSSLKALRGESRSRRMALQNEMLIRSRFVEILLALGAFEPAWVRMEQILDRPDRSGMVSYAPGLVELGNYVLGYAVINARLAEVDEQLSIRPLTESWSLLKTNVKLRIRRATIARHIRRLASSADYLERIVRPYMYENMMWYTLPIVHALGGAVMERSAATALGQEKELIEKSKVILNTFRVVSLHERGELEDTVRLAERALQSLPDGTVLLKAYIEAILADSLKQTDNYEAAFTKFGLVMDRFPTALRMMGLSLPVKVAVSGTKAETFSDILLQSPRFERREDSPFMLQITQEGQRISMCLTGTKRYGCKSLRLDASEEEKWDTIDAFHRQVFAPGIELSQSDMSSLDGRAVEGDAQSVIEDLIGRPGQKK